MTLKRVIALKTSIVTQWRRVWLCACSVLNAKTAFKMLISKWHEFVQKALVPKEKRFASMANCFRTIEDLSFWSGLENNLMLLIPSVESSLVLQGRGKSLADVMYCRCRQFLKLWEAGENIVVGCLENRWRLTGLPLMLMTFYFFPAYREFEIQMEISKENIAKIVGRYASRWESSEMGALDDGTVTSFTSAVDR